MRLISPHRYDSDREIPPGVTVWWTDTNIGATYARIAQAAVAEEWGADLIVIQDDVRLLTVPEISDRFDLIVYGQSRGRFPGSYGQPHVCPRAFAASSSGWAELNKVWMIEPNSLCDGFMRVIGRVPSVIMDVTSHG